MMGISSSSFLRDLRAIGLKRAILRNFTVGHRKYTVSHSIYDSSCAEKSHILQTLRHLEPNRIARKSRRRRPRANSRYPRAITRLLLSPVFKKRAWSKWQRPRLRPDPSTRTD